MVTLSEEVFTTRAGYIRTRIYHNNLVVEEECTIIALEAKGWKQPLKKKTFWDFATIFQGLMSDKTRFVQTIICFLIVLMMTLSQKQVKRAGASTVNSEEF
ncbi:hypothetical protein P5673_024814 [Acropora cervicornis]|uniref:Uncharacterized protein n=1 Tax=Acropora cervicornis TaxID=6130 RepID=A0AAD9Q305_ACRCE|nr:hypothetical protein P5673_024814 [Acropora cervicornis]